MIASIAYFALDDESKSEYRSYLEFDAVKNLF